MGDERPGARRLSRSGEFERVYREGNSRGNRYLVLYAFARGDGSSEAPRVGVSVGRKLGRAVRRNRVKRMVREAFWKLADELPPGHDFVIVARPDCAELVKDDGAAGVERSLGELVADAFPARAGGGRKT
jgi:ribonuclease P protein component